MTLRSVAPFPTNLLFHKIFAGALKTSGVLCAYFTRTSPPRRSKAFWSCSFVLQKSKDFSACSSVCGTRKICVNLLLNFSTAALSSPRCFVHRTRFGSSTFSHKSFVSQNLCGSPEYFGVLSAYFTRTSPPRWSKAFWPCSFVLQKSKDLKN